MAKRSSQLVCPHLENIPRKMLEEYQDIIRDLVRGRNGVCALYRRGKLYYVGLASSLLGRLRLTVTFEVKPEDGLLPQRVEETKTVLQELGLDDHVEEVS